MDKNTLTSLLFIFCTVFSVWIFFRAARNSGLFLLIVLGWLVLHSILAKTGFYDNRESMPPRFLLAPLPALLGIITIFLLPAGRRWLDTLDIKSLTLLHVVRIPVEIVLFLLYKNMLVPKIMTFEGNNLDILSGISAVLVFFLLFRNNQVRKIGLLIWNLACLGLLINIVSIAVLSLPLPFQQFGFEQPNVALFFFPYIWLPACVVPLVLLSHLAVIRRILLKKPLT